MKLLDMDEVSNMDLMLLAFEKGYKLGRSDREDGIYIEFSETRNYFLEELDEFYAKGSTDKNASFKPEVR